MSCASTHENNRLVYYLGSQIKSQTLCSSGWTCKMIFFSEETILFIVQRFLQRCIHQTFIEGHVPGTVLGVGDTEMNTPVSPLGSKDSRP